MLLQRILSLFMPLSSRSWIKLQNSIEECFCYSPYFSKFIEFYHCVLPLFGILSGQISSKASFMQVVIIEVISSIPAKNTQYVCQWLQLQIYRRWSSARLEIFNSAFTRFSNGLDPLRLFVEIPQQIWWPLTSLSTLIPIPFLLTYRIALMIVQLGPSSSL